MCFHDEHGAVRSLPATWTDVVEPDPFVVVATGRSPLHIDDLPVLAGMARSCAGSFDAQAKCPYVYAATVRKITPNCS